MAPFAGVHRSPNLVTVTSIGGLPNEGWQIVARLPKAKLPAANSGYSFLVTGKMGRFRWSGSTPEKALCEVAIGSDAGTRNPYQTAASYLREPLGQERAHGFQFLMHVNALAADPLFGSSWSNAFDLVVWARIGRNTDPASFAAAFDVADIAFAWFHVSAIGSGRVACGSAEPSAVMNASDYATLWQSGAAFGAANERWLHLQAVRVMPSTTVGSLSAPRMRFGYTVGGAAFTAKVGLSNLWGRARHHNPLGVSPDQPVVAMGCAWHRQIAGATERAAIQGFTGGGAAPATLWTHRSLALRVDDLPGFAVHESSSRVGMLRNDSDVAGVLNFEPAVSNHVAPMLFGYATQVSLSAFLHPVHAWKLRFNGNRRVLDSNLFLHGRGPNEGIADLVVIDNGLVPSPFVVRYEAFQQAPPGWTFADVFDAADVLLLQFHPDPSPSNVAAVPPNEAPIVIAPGRESIAVESLPDLPVAPDGDYTMRPLAPDEQRIDGGTGYGRTWRMLGYAREEYGLRWTNRTKAQIATLAAFLTANRWFRWTPRHETAAVPLVQIAPPEWSLGAPTGSAAATVVRLAFTSAP